MFSSQGSSSPQWPYTDSHHPPISLDSSNIPPYPVPFGFGDISSAGQHTSSSQLGYASTHYEQQSLSHPPPSSFLMETPAQPSDIHLLPSSRLSYMRGGPPHDDDPDVSRKRRASDEPACSGPTNRQRQESPPPISLSTARLLPPALTNTTQAELVDVRAATPTTHSSTTVDRRTDGSRPLSLPPPTSTASHPPNRSSGGPRQTTAATDLWYFVFGTSDKDKPADRATISRTEKFSVKPSTTKYSYLGCRACLDDGKHTIWKNANGCNKHIRNHLTRYHAEEYRAQTEEHNLKKIYTVVSSSPERVVRNTTDPLPKDPSMKAGFERRLAEWLAVDKQAIHNFECPEFQRLLLYLAQGRLADEDIPSPTKLEKIMIFQSFDNLVQDLAASLGDISFTYNTWTRFGHGFVALTAHWCAESLHGDLVIRSELAALQYISHKGIEDVLKERLENLGRLGITKIGKITGECCLGNHKLDGRHMSCFKRDIVDAVIDLAADILRDKEPHP
ncbi:hypothetical protein QCA50_004654 [Cerrena zonata]|uniref:BED-type domain-containing protein n=1 Tax=Cerrena zonata TaxID=2478898 RepID=A0AAW0GP29_9APHY